MILVSCRERDRLETKYREQLDALTDRGNDLDQENRQLRSLKYELDTRVKHQNIFYMPCRTKFYLSHVQLCHRC